ncbi:hypothetical protein [Arthrobacter sp. UYCo732]|uniref:hypothetical protein n=1 Tax=Arthrobacter sp. UYCo732 TaxID=3156336 RepID=UPI0033933296
MTKRSLITALMILTAIAGVFAAKPRSRSALLVEGQAEKSSLPLAEETHVLATSPDPTEPNAEKSAPWRPNNFLQAWIDILPWLIVALTVFAVAAQIYYSTIAPQ